jgi:hypothetical protein
MLAAADLAVVLDLLMVLCCWDHLYSAQVLDPWV